jgi:subtilisin family serine protease
MRKQIRTTQIKPFYWRSRLFFLASIVIAGFFPHVESAASIVNSSRHSSSKQPKYKAGEIIIRYKSDPGDAQQPSANASTRFPSINLKHARHKIKKQKRLFEKDIKTGKKSPQIQQAEDKYFSNIFVLNTDENADIEKIIADYKNDPNVEYVEPNYLYSVVLTPNDPDFSQQWSPQKIAAPAGWDYQIGDSNVVVAVIDTGVDLDHPDLQANIWRNINEIPGNGIDDDGNGTIDDRDGYNAFASGASPRDDHGHGTHVAGIVGAVGNNGIGIAGISWHSKIMAIKGLDASGWGDDLKLALAITYAAQNGAKIINCSWGGFNFSSTISNAIGYAVYRDAIVIAAAGNSDTSAPYYPAAYGNVLAVASSDNQDIRSWFSNYGPHIDVTAPGESIYSTMPTYHVTLNNSPDNIPNTYAELSGTSMAAPHVSGLAALILSQNPSFYSAHIRQAILNHANNIDILNPQFSYLLGRGRINAAQSIGVPGFVLTVTDGRGGGNYLEGAVVPILANDPPANHVWDKWVGSGIADPNSAQTTITMPASNISVTATYKPAPRVYGTVTGPDGFPMEGVLVTLHDYSGPYMTQLTDVFGNYSFSNPPKQFSEMYAEKTDFGFNPPRVEFIFQDDDIQVNFNGYRAWTVSGTIRESTGLPIPHARLDLSGDSNQAITSDAAGHYSFEQLPNNGNFSVIVRMSGYNMSPAQRDYPALTNNMNNQYFVGEKIWDIHHPTLSKLLNHNFAPVGLSVDANRNPHIAFHNLDGGLSHAVLNQGTWDIQTVDNSIYTQLIYPAVETNNNGTTYIAYSADSKLFLAQGSGSSWTKSVLDSVTRVGSAVAMK